MSKANKFLAKLRKQTGGHTFAQDKELNPPSWISTGDYSLNRIISGDIHKGVPSGKIILFGGESSSGKSLITASIAANALADGYDHIFYFDSEGGALTQFFEQQGADMDKIERKLVSSVEDATVQILKTFKIIQEWKEEDPDVKFLMILDSLGALVADKLLSDAIDKGRQASDMGLTAKQKNSLMKSVMIPAEKTNTSLLIVNHIYDDPSAMYGTKIKQQSGGRGVQYASHIAIQCRKSITNDNKNADDEAEYSSNTLVFLVTKNRDVKPFYECEMQLDFSSVRNKWHGLWDAAVSYGFIQGSGFYTVPSYSDKKFRRKQIMETDAIWESFIEEFNAKSIEDMSYGPCSGSAEDQAQAMLDEYDVEENTEEKSDNGFVIS
jgi:RecA/RadA recombinase